MSQHDLRNQLVIPWANSLSFPEEPTIRLIEFPYLLAKMVVNAFTTGNPFWGTHLLDVSIGRELGL